MITLSTQGTAGTSSSSTIVCGCFDLSAGAMADILAANPDMSFDQFLAETRAGSKCTACLLDLEYQFMTLPRERRGAAQGRQMRAPATRPLKRRIYDFLDRLSPPIPLRMTNTIPLLAGVGVAERLWLVNKPMFFGEAVAAPAHSYRVVVRDADGRVLDRARHDVPSGESVCVELSRHLPVRADGGLTVGSVEITRHAVTGGVRGTTRPHFEITAARSNCTLHSQAGGPQPEDWLAAHHAPADTRLIFTVVNTAPRPLAVDFDVVECDGNAEVTRSRVDVPGHGARLYEAEIPDRLRGRPLVYHFRGRGRGKVHVISATPSLDRLAIDHL